MSARGLVQGKVALVTGAASGIGRATALAFAREGAAALAVCDVDEAGGVETAEAASKEGAEARFFPLDVSDESQVEAAVRACVDVWGGLDCGVNNAGINGPAGLLHQCSLEDWNRTLAVNLTGVFLCMKHEIPAMIARGGGAIVNVSSGAGVIAVPGLSPYCASKHAILGITKTAAVENAMTGVRVNAVLPGSTDTPLLRGIMDRDPGVEKMVRRNLPGGRLGLPEEIAEAAVWLCCDRASFVTGDSMLVDGGAVAR